MTNAEVEAAAKDIANRQGLTWTSLSPDRRIAFFERALHDKASTVRFPRWVKVTTCKTRTFSLVLPRNNRSKGGRHGAVRIEKTFENRPTIAAPRNGLPGLYTKWDDTK